MHEFPSCRKKPHRSHRSMHSGVFPHPLQTPFSPFGEIWWCHLCGHEGHLVESCLLPAECTDLAFDPRFLIRVLKTQHMLLFSKDGQRSPKLHRFLSSCCQYGRAVSLQYSALPLESVLSAGLFCSLLHLHYLLPTQSPSTEAFICYSKKSGIVSTTACCCLSKLHV